MNDPEPDLEKGEINQIDSGNVTAESGDISASRDGVIAKPNLTTAKEPVAEATLRPPTPAIHPETFSPLTATDIKLDQIPSANSIINDMSEDIQPELSEDSLDGKN